MILVVFSRTKREECIIICLYVDDTIIFRPSMHLVNETKALICSHFDTSNLSEVDVILGIKVNTHDNFFALNQSCYVKIS